MGCFKAWPVPIPCSERSPIPSLEWVIVEFQEEEKSNETTKATTRRRS
jgi:hypothetical protein